MNKLERELLNHYQRDFPLCPRPYAAMAEKLGVSEEVVLDTIRSLKEKGVISRAGAVIAPKKAGVSTLAALQVPADRLEKVAEKVNAYKEVNHNYQREHDYNLWFVITSPSQERLEEVIRDIELETGLSLLYLPLEKEYFIDLGFNIQWN